MMMFTFSVFEWKYPSWTNLVQKLETDAEFNGGVHFLCFRLEIPFLGQFGPKNQNCKIKLKFGAWTNSNMKNSMVIFIFFLL